MRKHFFIMGIIGMGVVTFVLLRASFLQAETAATEFKKNKEKKAVEIDFDELLIRGKYHFLDKSLSTDGKILDGLLEVRKDYKDRIQKTATWY